MQLQTVSLGIRMISKSSSAVRPTPAAEDQLKSVPELSSVERVQERIQHRVGVAEPQREQVEGGVESAGNERSGGEQNEV